MQTFTYDAFGNLTDIVGDPGPPIGINSQTNRVTAGAYDAAGNMTSWAIPEGGTNQYSYGPFNEVWRVATPSEEWVHVYSADDERILSWQVGGAQVNRWTLRGLDNRVLREYHHSRIGGPTFIERDNIYRGSGPLLAAATPSGDRHYHVDHLGTPRQITDATGAQVAFHTYWPYGEEATLPNQDAVRYKFTGHERDFGDPNTPTDDHDHMHARMSNPRLGRFLSVDPVLAGGRAIKQPQTWNRYAYVAGNPLKHVDPTGAVFQIAGCGKFEGGHEQCEVGKALLTSSLGNSSSKVRINSNGTVSLARGVSGSQFAALGDFQKGLLTLIGHKSTFSLFAGSTFEAREGGGGQSVPLKGGGANIFIDPSMFPKDTGDVTGTAAITFVHEIGHALETVFPEHALGVKNRVGIGIWGPRESYAITFENSYRRSLGMGVQDLRYVYLGDTFLTVTGEQVGLFP